MDWKLNKGHVCREGGTGRVLVGLLPSRSKGGKCVCVCVPPLLGTGTLEMRFAKKLQAHRSFPMGTLQVGET